MSGYSLNGIFSSGGTFFITGVQDRTLFQELMRVAKTHRRFTGIKPLPYRLLFLLLSESLFLLTERRD
jgi:hypothetical protein